jgi:peptidylprolyl isomerase
MTSKLFSLAILACAAAAIAQTTHPAASSAHSTAHHAATTKAETPNIPKVAGLPKTLFALKYIDIQTGAGPLAKDRQYYTVRYTGWLANGTKFDSSYDHPGAQPIVFPYGARSVIAGWDTGFQGMHVGGKRRLFIPYQLAYGETGRPPVIPAQSDLIFDIELVAQSDTPPQPKQPSAATPDASTKPAETNPDTKSEPAPSTPATQPETPSHPQSL